MVISFLKAQLRFCANIVINPAIAAIPVAVQIVVRLVFQASYLVLLSSPLQCHCGTCVGDLLAK